MGKTTLIMKVFEALKTSQPSLQFQGFCTRALFLYLYELGLIACLKFEKDDDGGFVGEVRQGSERVGFEVVTLDGRRGRLASTTISTSPLSLTFSLRSHISTFASLLLTSLMPNATMPYTKTYMFSILLEDHAQSWDLYLLIKKVGIFIMSFYIIGKSLLLRGILTCR